MEHPEPVPVLVRCDISETKRIRSCIVVEGVECIEDHVTVLWEVVVSEHAPVPIVLEIECADTDITSNPELTRCAVCV